MTPAGTLYVRDRDSDQWVSSFLPACSALICFCVPGPVLSFFRGVLGTPLQPSYLCLNSMCSHGKLGPAITRNRVLLALGAGEGAPDLGIAGCALECLNI